MNASATSISTPTRLSTHFRSEEEEEEEKESKRYKRTNGARRSFQKIPLKLRKHFQHLRFLSEASPTVRRKFVAHAPDSFIDCCSELSANYCDGRIDCTPAQKRRLARYKDDLRALAKKKTGLGTRRKILQRGGFLPALAIPIITAVGGLLPTLINWIRGK